MLLEKAVIFNFSEMKVTEAATKKAAVHDPFPDPTAAALPYVKGFARTVFSFFHRSDSLQGIPVLSSSYR